jgi:hypothetical protein
MSDDTPASREDFEAFGKAVEAMTLTMKAAADAQTAAIRELAQAMADHRQNESTRADGGSAYVRIYGDDRAQWRFVTMGYVMLACTAFLAGIVFWSAGRTSDQGHQMNALYQSVPGLRELVNRQMELIDRTNKQQDQKP